MTKTDTEAAARARFEEAAYDLVAAQKACAEAEEREEQARAAYNRAHAELTRFVPLDGKANPNT